MERQIPLDEAAEQSVIGAMLCNPQTIAIASEMLTGGDFYRKSDGDLFHAVVSMWLEDEGSVDTVTLSAKFPESREYISHLVDRCPVSTNIKHYAEIVKRDSVARALIRAGQEIVELGYDEDEDPAKLIDTAEHKLTSLRPKRGASHHHVSDLGASILRSIASGDTPSLVSTGFASIDNYLQGLYAGNFVIIGARPGVGKTCLGLSIAQRVSKTGTVAFFSLEMRGQELMERLFASLACVSITKIREQNLTPDEHAALVNSMAEVEQLDLRIIDDTSLTTMALASQVRTLARQNDLKLVVVDYLQLMSLGGRVESRFQEVSEMSRRLKSLAMEVGIPIIALSQLNRVSTFDGGSVDISQLRESGSLEQDADVVILLDWPKQEEFGQRSVNVKVAKNRHGPVGTVDLIWLPQYARYEE